MQAPPNSPSPHIARSAGTVMLAFLVSQAIGLVTKILIGRNFPSFEVDAFLAANRPSETLVFIMTGGIFVSSFIPVLVNLLVREERASAWRLASALANWILVFTLFTASLLALLADPIVKNILAVFFSPEKQDLTANLLRIQAISVIFFSFSGLLIGILNSHKRFLVSALAPAMYQIGQLIGILALSPRIGVYGLAWGVVIGSFLNFLIQVPSVISLKPLYFPTFGSKERHLVNVLSLMAPRIFGAAIVQLMLWVNTLLASKYDGAILAISYGFSLMMVAQIAIAQSVATAVMPTFSTQYASGKLDSLRSTLSSALRAEIFLSIPASVGLICLSTPLVAFLYQYGEFSEETTHMVAWALIWYSTGLVFHAVQEVLVRAFYAMHDTKTPVAVGSLAMTLSIGLSILFSSLFVRLGWMPHGGLALAVSLSTAVEVFALFIFMRRKLGNLHGTSIAIGFGIAASASMVMLGFLLGWLQITQSSPTYIVALGGSLLGGLVYVFVLGLFRIPELKWLLGNISNHLEKTKKVPPG